MASNEHKNLSEANLHNPKGLSTASNHSICTKDGVAQLAWIEKRFIKMSKKTLAGYCTLTANYQYPEGQIYGQSPYDINQDYGSATISAATTAKQKHFFRIGQVAESQAGEIQSGTLQVTSTDAETFVVALVKYTPTPSTADVYPTVLFEQSVVGLSSDNKVNSYTLDVGTFTNTAIAAGDHIFLMIKGTGAEVGQTVYANVSIEIGYAS